MLTFNVCYLVSNIVTSEISLRKRHCGVPLLPSTKLDNVISWESIMCESDRQNQGGNEEVERGRACSVLPNRTFYYLLHYKRPAASYTLPSFDVLCANAVRADSPLPGIT